MNKKVILMMHQKAKLSMLVIGAFVSTLSAASNFSYTEVSGYTGKYSLEVDPQLEPYVADTGKNHHISVSHQVTDNLAFRLSGDYKDGTKYRLDRADLTETRIEVTSEFPIAVNSKVDVVPFAGMAQIDQELCLNDECSSAEDEGAVYGGLVRTWFPSGVFSNYFDYFEFNVRYSDYQIPGVESTTRFGLGGWFNDNHRVEVRAEDSEQGYTYVGGYSYTW